MSSEFTTTGRFATVHASRYLQQTAKHFAHKLDVRHNEWHAEILFPRAARGADWPADARVVLDADDQGLRVVIIASAAGQRDGLQRAIGDHVQRFAFREPDLSSSWTQP
jgi:hypothetical protein